MIRSARSRHKKQTFPQGIKAGHYHFAVGTAGSCKLVLQTILPALVTADGPSQVVLEGGRLRRRLSF